LDNIGGRIREGNLASHVHPSKIYPLEDGQLVLQVAEAGGKGNGKVVIRVAAQ
jgi:NADPH:quinone reductase-like Zn-dependent oxidoreductase